MFEFAKVFRGEPATETMLVKGVNDDLDGIKRIGEFLTVLKPAKAYVAIPTRSPAERVMPASEQTTTAAYQIFSDRLSRVEYLIGYERNDFACTGNVQEDLLSTTAVHPMREEAVAEILKSAARAGKPLGSDQEPQSRRTGISGKEVLHVQTAYGQFITTWYVLVSLHLC